MSLINIRIVEPFKRTLGRVLQLLSHFNDYVVNCVIYHSSWLMHLIPLQSHFLHFIVVVVYHNAITCILSGLIGIQI